MAPPRLVRHGRVAVALVVLTAALAWIGVAASLARPVPAVVDRGLPTGPEVAPVVVQGRPGRGEEAARAAARLGVQVGEPLPLIDGFAARASGDAVAALASSPDVVAITLDRPGAFHSLDPQTTTRTSSAFPQATEASGAWDQGLRGSGVTVAVLDTGISPVPDLAGRTLLGPDLSGEGSAGDSYGHGTVMGGIIAGDGHDSGGRRRGVAPDARLVAVKVAGRNGAVDVSTVLQGMTWVAAHRQELGIRVLNLSYGTTSTQDPTVDPLNFAVERLWAQGIVVVVAAGNGGPAEHTITKPGDDPVVLTVGAYDDRGNGLPADDVVSPWSSRGPTAQGVAKPDLVAPGRTVVATRSPGSTVELQNPDSLVPPSYVKGSGTSEATAVTTGLVALLLQAHPAWTPDQVKGALTSTAAPLPRGPASATGHGRARVLSALAADPGPQVQQALPATGLGSLEASRGDAHVVAACGVIVGEQDVLCHPWDGNAWTGNAWTGNAWTGNAWTGNAWTGNAWTGNAWTGNAWTGNAWTGNAWTGNAWTGNAWTSLGPVAGGGGGPDRMLTAFWGDGPRRAQQVPGEVPVELLRGAAGP